MVTSGTFAEARAMAASQNAALRLGVSKTRKLSSTFPPDAAAPPLSGRVVSPTPQPAAASTAARPNIRVLRISTALLVADPAPRSRLR